MPFFRTITTFSLVCAMAAVAQRPVRKPDSAQQEEAPARPRLGPPTRLLGQQAKWQIQSGAWKADAEAGSVSCASDGTLAEYSAAASVKLAGHWLALTAALTGTDPKAGIWFAGVRDKRGEVLRLALDSASGGITGARNNSICALPEGAFANRIEVVLIFSADKVTIHHGGRQLAEIPVQFDDPAATPSLFVERGEATFHEVLLSGEPAPEPPPPAPRRVASAVPLATLVEPAPAGAAAAPVAPVKPAAAAQPAAPRQGSLDFAPERMTSLRSGWNDYFGVHFETAHGPWKMARQIDGPELGIPPQGRHTGDVKQFPGPFAQVPVDLSLADFRDWKRKDSKGLDELLPALVRDDRQGLFIAPWSGPIGKLEQDQIYALMKLTYGANPAMEGRFWLQWGDSLNDGHYGTKANARRISSQPSGSARLGRGANTPEDLTACAENYLAPAIEAVRHASAEIYKNPRQIPIIAGSCAASGDPKNREWYGRLFDTVLEGSSAPSLKGRRLASLVDILTVNYPFAGTENDAALQELWDRFCAAAPAPAEGADEKNTRPRGLWVTEEYGQGTHGPGTLTARAARFLAWAARNNLDAGQTRLLWNIPPRTRGAQDAMALTRSLGESLGNGPLRIATQDFAAGRLYRISAGDGRLMLAYHPVDVRRGRRAVPIGEVALAVTDAQVAKAWIAHLHEDSGKRSALAPGVLEVRKEGSQLLVNVTATDLEPWSLVVETP